MKAAAVIACRLESSRLFGKPMQRVGGKSILEHLVKRLRKVHSLEAIVLALSDAPGKAVFIEFAREHGLPYVVGDEMNVLSRMIAAAHSVAADIVIRHTSDNPFPYWENLDELIYLHQRENADLSVTTGLPLGTYVEVISTTALERSAREGEDRHRGEFCDLFIVENPDKFKILKLKAPDDVSGPQYRLTVDTPQDLMMMAALCEQAGQPAESLSLSAIVDVLRRHPRIASVNCDIPGKHIWA